jgi:adenylyltransferase/sulfurtransferase
LNKSNPQHDLSAPSAPTSQWVPAPSDADTRSADLLRYSRQVAFGGLGPAGQAALRAGRVLVVGVGGLGSWTAELLARAGVGFLRLVDGDAVDLTNLHRQGLYDESDAAAGAAKVNAARRRLGRINAGVAVEAVPRRLGRANALALAGDVDLIVDGTDNWATRLLLNDLAVKLHRPWIFAGVVGAEAQTMTVLPGRSACLRCIMDAPPPRCQDPTCEGFGVLGPAVSAIASLQAAEAIKILAGRVEEVSPYLTKIDLWTNSMRRIDVSSSARDPQCACCGRGDLEFLDP